MGTSLFRLPAGTTSNPPLVGMIGSADPQVGQKHLVCRVADKLNCLTLFAPESHLMVAVD
jgi:hypothetical protein